MTMNNRLKSTKLIASVLIFTSFLFTVKSAHADHYICFGDENYSDDLDNCERGRNPHATLRTTPLSQSRRCREGTDYTVTVEDKSNKTKQMRKDLVNSSSRYNELRNVIYGGIWHAMNVECRR